MKQPPRGKSLGRVRLIHWHAGEAERFALSLRGAGYDVEAGPIDSEGWRALRKDLPDAFVISLERRPSHGMEIGSSLRVRASTRHVPLVFVVGDTAMVVRVRELIPDAYYVTWRGVAGALRKGIARAATGYEPKRVATVLAGYSGTPLPKKLGIKEGIRVTLIGAPKDFERTLGDLPPGVTVSRRDGPADLTLWFVPQYSALARDIRSRAAAVGSAGLWILWQKKSSGYATDVDEASVRRTGLDNGLVDYKICAVDERWSGLRFAKRKA